MKKMLLVLGALVGCGALLQADMLDDLNNTLKKTRRGLVQSQINAWINKFAKAGIQAGWDFNTKQFERVIPTGGGAGPRVPPVAPGAGGAILISNFANLDEVITYLEVRIMNGTAEMQKNWKKLANDADHKTFYDEYIRDTTGGWGANLAEYVVGGVEQGNYPDVKNFYENVVQHYAKLVGAPGGGGAQVAKFADVEAVISYIEEKMKTDHAEDWNKLQADAAQKAAYEAYRDKIKTNDDDYGWGTNYDLGYVKAKADEVSAADVNAYYQYLVKAYADKVGAPGGGAGAGVKTEQKKWDEYLATARVDNKFNFTDYAILKTLEWASKEPGNKVSLEKVKELMDSTSAITLSKVERDYRKLDVYAQDQLLAEEKNDLDSPALAADEWKKIWEAALKDDYALAVGTGGMSIIEYKMQLDAKPKGGVELLNLRYEALIDEE